MIRVLRQRIKYVICTRPKLYGAWVSFRRPERRRLTVDRSVELVIEGYPRSANTFAVLAFEQAQARHVGIAHHTHVPATVIQGCLFNIPVIVLIRNPLDAVASTMIFTQRSARILLEEWIWFYSSCWNVRDKFLVAYFEDVIKDFGKTIESVNRRWKTCFSTFKSNEETLANVRAEVEAVARRYGQGEEQVARPSAIREKQKEVVRESILSERHLLCQANFIYENYKRLAPQ